MVAYFLGFVQMFAVDLYLGWLLTMRFHQARDLEISNREFQLTLLLGQERTIALDGSPVMSKGIFLKTDPTFALVRGTKVKFKPRWFIVGPTWEHPNLLLLINSDRLDRGRIST